jgi:endonuclease-8
VEGPPLRVIAEKLSVFKGKQILKTTGNSRIDKESLIDQNIFDVFSWGKNLFLKLRDFSLKIHFLMFGSYRINEEKKGVVPRLSLVFSGGEMLNFYSCSIRLLSNSDVTNLCDMEIDIMSEKWNMQKVMDLVSNMSEKLICDVLLDQKIFVGVGNIIKNEALYISHVHPLSIVGKIPKRRMEEISMAAREFSSVFYNAVRNNESIRKSLSIYGKRECPETGERVIVQKTGDLTRISYFCSSAQELFV